MNKNIFYILFSISFLLFSCADKKEIKVFYSSGNLKQILSYSSGELNGKCAYYKDKGVNKVVELKNYSNGLKDGKSLKFHENGRVKVEEFYKNDKKEGERTEWFENGCKKSESNYENGKLKGKYCEWNENSKLIINLNIN